MKPMRYISLIIVLLSALGLAAQQQQSQYALYNYRNDGDFNAWLNIDVDSITYSNIGLDSVEYDNIVTQEVWTPDSCYRIPIEVVDSIAFRAPKPVLRDGIFYLREYHAAHTNAIDSLTIYFDSSISQDSLPAINQKVLSLTPTYPYEGGFAGRVVRITNIDSGIEVECERVDIADIFSHLILVGKAVSVDESPTTPKSGRRDFSFDNEDMGTIQFTINSDFEKSLFNGIYTVKTKKPKVTCGYYVYVDELFYKISADAYIRHDDLSHTIKINNDILQRLDTETYALLYELMNNDSMDEDEFKEMDKKLMELAWKKKVPLFEIPVGPVVFKLEFCPMVKLNGRVEASYQYSTKAIQHIGFEASGSTVAAVLNPYTVSLGILKNMNHTYVEDKSSANQKFGLAFNGSFTLGASLKLSACLWTEKVLRVSVAGEGGLKLTGTIDVNFDTTDFDSEEDDMYNFPLWYGLTKDTKANAKLYAKISGEVGATPSDFFTLKGDIEPESWQEDLGTVYLFPHFTKPSLPYKYEMGEWEYSPLTLHSTPSNDLMLSCDLGMIMTDSNKNRLFYTPQKEEYKKQEEWYEKYGDISISVASLDPGTYYCYPAFKLWGDKFWKAGPYTKIEVPEPMSISTNSEVLPKGKTVYVNINGGWGYYSASSSNSSICTAEIVENGQYQVKIVTSKSMTGPATVTVKDLRAGTTETILISVSDDGPVGDHEWVDLGLPSGTLWATCNVGANSPEEYGDYFAWGETEPKDYYGWWTYKWCNGSSHTLTKYCDDSEYGYNGFTDGLTELLPEDDAATANWGSDWRMPSDEQTMELRIDRYVTYKWTMQNGVNGYKITSNSNGKSIFLPAAGYRYGTSLDDVGDDGYYWSCECDLKYADFLHIASYNLFGSNTDRSEGMSVRPVRVKKAQRVITAIVLSEESSTLRLNETKTLTAFIQPSYATNRALTWESSNESVATVSSEGLVKAVAAGACVITCSAVDGSSVKAECQVTVTSGTTPDPGNHEWVDLGLPSGTLWATCNVGASSPEEYGDYFAWGETAPKDEYNWSTYKWMNAGQSNWRQINKYTFADGQTDACWYSNGTFVGDGKTELDPEDDAATANWGVDWQMPSLAQQYELINNNYTITIESITHNGVNGRLIMSRSNGNRIFLPAAGEDAVLDYAGSNGNYWSRSLYTQYSDTACGLFFNQYYNVDWDFLSRCDGYTVRPVRKQ